MKGFAWVTGVVLLVIAIGIGLVGGLASFPSRIYGQAPLSFSAAFPTTFTGPPVVTKSLRFGTSYVAFNDSKGYSAEVWVTPEERFVERLAVKTVRGFVTLRALNGMTSKVNGATITTYPARCQSVFPGLSVCFAGVVVREDGLVWRVTASSPRNPAVAEAFVNSFRLLS